MYVDPDGEIVWFLPDIIIGAAIGGYSGYKIGKAKGATGWGMFGYIAGGAAIGTVAGHIGASLFASSMTAATAAGYGGFSAGFNAGLISGMAAGGFSGGGMAALRGGNILAGATMGAWFGGVTGGLMGGRNYHIYFPGEYASDGVVHLCPSMRIIRFIKTAEYPMKKGF